jgi:chloramphenicol O-acetyltransferase type A
MKKIDLTSWPRQVHFEVFKAFDYPHFNMCANVDISQLLPAVKGGGWSFTAAVVYLLARTANDMPPFCQRIRGDEVVEHEVVHPSPTILAEGDLFSFCTIPYTPDFPGFAVRAAERIAHVRSHPILEDEPGQDDLLFMTSIPWVSFTSFMHPIHLHPIDSVPRLAWGKYFEEGERVKMPLSVQVHHALMDGLHVGRYYERVQDYLSQPQKLFG